jgi:hypothetical protein
MISCAWRLGQLPDHAVVAASPLVGTHPGWRSHDHGSGAMPWSWQWQLPFGVCAWEEAAAIGLSYRLDLSSVWMLVARGCVGRRCMLSDSLRCRVGYLARAETSGPVQARGSYVGLPPLSPEGSTNE